jgi:hypothetical protein
MFSRKFSGATLTEKSVGKAVEKSDDNHGEKCEKLNE